MATTPTSKRATVYLVGAGPGDPGLVTLRAVECLQRADTVLYDYLVNPAVLEHAPPTAELRALGRPGTGRALSPRGITSQMVAEALAGRTVVRLKGGDPSVFGRGADETTALREAGIPFEIVPGVTTGLAVAAYCEIPITQQDDASAVALIAGRERDDKTESRVDYAALAAFPGTLVFYMGVGRAAEWSRALIAQGRSADTPVAIVRWCTRAEQEFVRCTLGTVVDVIASRGLKPPAIFVVGDVVDRAPDLSWFASRPLFGVRVLVPGSPATSRKLRERLSRLGADVVLQPAIRITDPPDWKPVDAALDRLADFDWVVFSSANGVDYLLRRLFDRGRDARQLGSAKLAAIGSGTADRLAEYHLHADLTPEEFVAESLARALTGDAPGRRFLLVRASRGRDVLADALAAAGASVEQIVAYGSVDVDEPSADVTDALTGGAIDWITITSGSAATALARLYGVALGRARFASIGPIASAALRALGHEPSVEAAPHTTDGLVEAMLRAQPASG
jgi:uroporphyrinogen III methyltransferase / synthase